jgi:Leucine-rich repeat (LRR) protein
MNELALQLIEENLRTQDPFLDLGNCGLTSLPNALFALTHLEALNLGAGYYDYEKQEWIETKNRKGWNELTSNKLEQLSQIPKLKALFLFRTISGGDISFIEKLTNLTLLDMRSNQIMDYSFIEKLTNLTLLNLWNNQIKDIRFLEKLTSLTNLNIGNNQIKDIRFLEKLTSLTTLDLRRNQIRKISLENFKNLSEINVSNNPLQSISLRNFPKIQVLDLSSLKLGKIVLNDLPSLQSLDLNNNQINKIHFLEKLTNLTNLYLYNNQITDIRFLEKLTSLTILDLRSNKITEIHFLEKLTNLTHLYLSWNQITWISLAFIHSFPKLEELILSNNPIQNIPKEIFNKEYQNVLKEVRNYLEALEEDGKIDNDQIKMLLLGNSTAGKTSLIAFLQKGIYEEKRVSTHGIENLIWQPFQEDKTANEIEKNIKVSVWDFGGQEFYHNTHSLFFSNNAIYLVLFEATTNFQGKKRTLINLYENGVQVEKEVDLEHFEHSYWLENVKYLNDSKEGVLLLAQNKCDLGQIIDISEACKKEYQLQSENIFSISVKNAFEQDKKFLLKFEIFKAELLEQIKKNIAKFDNSKKWQEIKNKIQSEWKQDNVLDYTEYVRRCQEIKPTIDDRKEGQSESQLDTLTKILCEQGIVLQYKHIPALKDKLFVNPAWLTDCIYKVLDYSVMQSAGKFDQKHVEKIAQTLPSINAEALLALLKHFDLIFEVDRMNRQWFICPQYLPEALSEEDMYVIDGHRESNNIKYSFTLSYPKFLPVSTFLKFLAKHGKNHVRYWYCKNELFFVENKKVVDAKCVRTKEERSITMYIQNGDTETAQKLFEELLSIDLPSDLQISVNEGKDFVEVKKLRNAFEKDFQEIESLQGNRLEIKVFWFLFERNETKPIETSNHILQKILSLIDKAEIAEVFEELEKAGIVTSEISQLKKEFISGKADFDFYDRLKTSVREALRGH